MSFLEPILVAFRTFARRFGWAAVYFLVLFAFGTVGFTWIESWSVFEAFYMSVTTVTSVGYMEVRPLSPEGRVLAMVLILLGVTGLGIWWGLITALIVELDLRELFRERRAMREIEKLSGHFIVCGIGNMGRVVAEEMRRSSIPYVAVEQNTRQIQALREEDPEALVIEGDATREHRLQEARIDTARGLAVCLTHDADNLFVSLTARGLNPDLIIVARAQDEDAFQKLKRAGADHAISPNITGGARMAAMLIRPSVVSFLDVAMNSDDLSLRLEETPVGSGSPLCGRTLAEARIPQQTGLVVLALRRSDGTAEFEFNPGPDARLEAGDAILTLGRDDQIAGLRQYVVGG